MRRMREAVFCFGSSDDGVPQILRQYRDTYRAISQVLDDNPKILAAVHEDLQVLSDGGSEGRDADYTSENILRALIVKHKEGLTYREAVIRIGSDPFLQDFLRLRKRAVMDFTFLSKCFKAIQPQTWKRINELLGQYAVAQKMIRTDVIRTDTTVVESNIHYPTDASLLWDTWRVSARTLNQAREITPGCCPHRFHSKKIKKLYLYVIRHMPSKSAKRQRQVKAEFRKLIERVAWMVGVVEEFCNMSHSSVEVAALAADLKTYLPAMKKVVQAATRSQIEGQKVPASERVFSIFEPHTELIMRGRREKPVEFGHKTLLSETKEKFITDYEVFELQQPDCELTEPVIVRHEKLFGKRPKVVAADKGFCPEHKKFEALAKLIPTLAIPQRMRDFMDKALVVWQKFRAGIEGTISGLKRAFRLIRCFHRGFKSFSSAVGLGVFCHNLIVLTKLKSG